MFLQASDPRLSFFCPQPVDRTAEALRLERFPESAYAAVRGQIGPLANLRSSSGCAVLLRTDSPEVELRLERLRHHQPVPVGVACEVEGEEGSWRAFSSLDLRELDGAISVRFATGLERGAQPRTVMLWLPLISTCAVVGVALAEGSTVEAVEPPAPQWLVAGDRGQPDAGLLRPVPHAELGPPPDAPVGPAGVEPGRGRSQDRAGSR
jgi:hypothetical protein